MSFNGYLYAYANPATLRDPTGRDPSYGMIPDPRDLTRWLYNEMMHNLNDSRLQDVRSTNRVGDSVVQFGTGLIIFGCRINNPVMALAGGVVDVAGLGAYGLAAHHFGQLVGDLKPWDFKHKINLFLGPGITLCASIGCQPDVEYSVPGNIHFGFVAREAGYAGVIVNMGAGYAEITDPVYGPSHPYDPTGKFRPVIGLNGISLLSLNFGDDPQDHQAVEFGIYLYESYSRGRSLTLSTVRLELSRFLPFFDRRSPDAAPLWTFIADDWPYPHGYFSP